MIYAAIDLPDAGGSVWGEMCDFRTLVPSGEIPSKLHLDGRMVGIRTDLVEDGRHSTGCSKGGRPWRVRDG